jgi:hypothetical protein
MAEMLSVRRRGLAVQVCGDSLPKLDDEIDNVSPVAVKRSDPFEMGFRQVQGVVEFSQDFFVRVARFRFYAVHL